MRDWEDGALGDKKKKICFAASSGGHYEQT